MIQAQMQPAGVLAQNHKQNFENDFPRQKKLVQRKDSNIFGTEIRQNHKVTDTISEHTNDEENNNTTNVEENNNTTNVEENNNTTNVEENNNTTNDEENNNTKNVEVPESSSSQSKGNNTLTSNNCDNSDKNIVFFENRWKTVEKSPVRLCIVRKPGYPRLSALDDGCGEILNFRREKSALTSFKNEDNLCNDRFLTGKETAQMLDVVKTPRNRLPLTDTHYGPFCNTTVVSYAGRVDHLDRTCVPKELTTKDPNAFVSKKHFTKLINKNRIYATEGFLIGDDATLSKSNFICHRYEPTTNQDSFQKYHGRARIVAPWTQSTNVLQ